MEVVSVFGLTGLTPTAQAEGREGMIEGTNRKVRRTGSSGKESKRG